MPDQPAPMGGMMMPSRPAPGADGLSGLFGMMADLAKKPQETPTDKVRRAISLLDEVRSDDPKQGSIASAAIHILRNGNEGVGDFFSNSSPPRMKR